MEIFFLFTLKLEYHLSSLLFCLGPQGVIINKKVYWFISDKVFDKLIAKINQL